MSTYRKKLIEVALPLEAINVASAREKSIRHGHPSTLHLWWARRPLAAARAVLFAQLVDDPASWPELFPTEEAQNHERQRLFRLIESLVQWENSNNKVVIDAARLEIARSHARDSSSKSAKRVLQERVTPKVVNEYLATELPPVHDPFAGGGTIPLEAQRLGLRAIASDLNPVAVMINKALVEFPARFPGLPPVSPESRANGKLRTWNGTEGLAEDVRHYGAWIRAEAKMRIGHLYPEAGLPKELGGGKATVIAWIWARTVESPNPAARGVHVPLVSSFWLAMKPGKKSWVHPVVDRRALQWHFEIRTGEPADPEGLQIGTRAGKAQDFVCLLTETPITREYIREQGKAGRLRERLMAVVAEGKSSRVYLQPSPEHERVARLADEMPVVAESKEGFLAGATPSRAMITGGVCSAYGLSTFGQLFTSRQLVALTTFADLGDEVCGLVKDHAASLGDRDPSEYANALAVYFACAVDRCADFWCSLATWSPQPKNELVSHAFVRQALPMTWDFGEVNPFSASGGNYDGNVAFVAKALSVCPKDVAPQLGTSRAFQADATHLDPAGALISTDPPYYDNIGYAELSDFFFAWMRRSLRARFPSEFATLLAPKEAELVATPYRHGGKPAAERFFLAGMSAFLLAARNGAANALPLTVYYAFKQSEGEAGGVSTGWETFLEAVTRAGLVVDGTWPLRTERATRTTGLGTNALASSIVLVCRARGDDAPTTTRGEFRRILRRELPDALKKLQQGNIAPVDVAQASIGPGMAIFSRHKQVVEADGSSMSVRSALQLINEVLDEYLASGEGDFDADTRFAITWYEQHGREVGPFGDAESVAKARNISVRGVVEAGICRSGAGKVRLIKREELPAEYDPSADERPTVWKFIQHMIRYLEEQGEEAAARHLKRLGSKADAARDLAYRLYNTCERKKWAEDARSYNGLIIAWPELEKLAARMADDSPVTARGKADKKGKKSKTVTRGQRDLFGGDDK